MIEWKLHLPYIGGPTSKETHSLRRSRIEASSVPQKTPRSKAFDDYIRRLLIDNTTLTSDVLDQIHAIWAANDTSLGAPFNTGFNGPAAWYTDEMFLWDLADCSLRA
ncbi:hypothetical protein BDZ89DRAFT_1166322 [Hymenopellis radicata]|nr:hypothetical protein BDZ89DRAFT_1166322 [Hymenopellis radicata]